MGTLATRNRSPIHAALEAGIIVLEGDFYGAG
jgi:hypothetical protein